MQEHTSPLTQSLERVKQLRFHSVLIIIACVTAIGIALVSLFGQSLQQDLLAKPITAGTLSPGYSVSQPQQPPSTTSVTQTQPTAAAQTSHMLAQDTFQRPDQPGWNLSSDGQTWQTNHGELMSIQQGVGVLVGTNEKVSARLGRVSTNADVICEASLSAIEPDGASIGAMLRYRDPDTWDKASLDGTHLAIIQHAPAGNTTLTSYPFQASAGTSYTIRFRSNGQNLEAKAWKTGTQEPDWMVFATDTQLQSGESGLRIILAPSVIVRVTSFIVQQALP